MVGTVLGAGDMVPSLKAFFLSAVTPDFDCLSHCIFQLTNKFQENFISTILLPSFQNFRPVLELLHIKWHFQFHSCISSDGNQSMLELWKSGLFSHMFSSDMMCYDILHGLICIRVNWMWMFGKRDIINIYFLFYLPSWLLMKVRWSLALIVSL